MDMENILKNTYAYLIEHGLQVLIALLIFVIGRWLAKLIARWLGAAMTKAKVEKTLVSFVEHVCYIALFVTVIIAALAKLGVQTAQYIAVLGAAGLAIGLALQGSLANFASGVLLIFFKPFKVGDFVELAGAKGTVREIQIFTTVLDTPDNVRVVIPNGQITGTTISNYTANSTRRVDLVIGVSYGDDLKKAQQVIEAVLASDKRVLKNPPAAVAVSELGDSSVNFVVRPWVKGDDYWDVYFGLTEQLKVAFDKSGLTIPFPQMDVNLKKETVSKLG